MIRTTATTVGRSGRGDVVRLPATALMVGAVALAAAACSASAGGTSTGGGQENAGPIQHPTALVGETGKDDGFTISLSDQNGARISNLAAGTYKLTVHDDSGIHNFHLAGAGSTRSPASARPATRRSP